MGEIGRGMSGWSDYKSMVGYLSNPSCSTCRISRCIKDTRSESSSLVCVRVCGWSDYKSTLTIGHLLH